MKHRNNTIKYFLVLCFILIPGTSCLSKLNVTDGVKPKQRYSAPIIYDNNFMTEHVRSGYELPIVPHPVSFSPDGRAYLRQKNGVYYVTKENKWAYFSFLETLNSTRQKHLSIDNYVRNDLRIVFDEDGYAYTPVLAYSNKVKQSYLMVKSHDSERWRAFKLPPGDPRIEWFSGAKMLKCPPAILIYNNPTVALVDINRDQDRILVSTAKEISRNALSIARLGSGGSVVVRTGDWIHTAFAFKNAPASLKGTAEMWSRYNPRKNEKQMQLLGMSPVFQSYPDSHDVPVIVSDSKGCLHAVLGAHNRVFQYLHTLQPADANEVTWSDPVVIGSKESRNLTYSDDNWNLTYPELVCDSKDTLHLVARQWKRSEGKSLVYIKKETGKGWTTPKKLVVASHGGYLNCYHKLMKDAKDRLFLTYYVYFNHFTDEQIKAYSKRFPEEKLVKDSFQGAGRYNYSGVKRKGPFLLVSEDTGNSWHMAEMNDLKASN